MNALRRHHRERVIRKRLGIVRTYSVERRMSRDRIEASEWYHRQPGRLDRHNLRCGCRMCRLQPPRYRWTRAATNAAVRREIAEARP